MIRFGFTKLCTTIVALLLTCAGAQAEFKFIALGDMPYGDPKKVYPLYETLIETINKRKPDFVVHVGDTKSGATECSDKILTEQLNYLNAFDGGVIYTPGDNEWTDCYRKKAGDFKPLKRLEFIRETYFKKPEMSFGKNPFAVKSQSVEMADDYKGYPENITFNREGVHFITAHVVGSNNNFEIRSRKAAMEFFDRDEANVAWLKRGFKLARKADAKAVVLAIHADMFEFDFNAFNNEDFLRHSGFRNFGRELVKQAQKFPNPILLVFGDSHEYRVFRPFVKRAPNISALEVFGPRDLHAVEVSVDPEDPAVFGFRPVYNPANQFKAKK